MQIHQPLALIFAALMSLCSLVLASLLAYYGVKRAWPKSKPLWAALLILFGTGLWSLGFWQRAFEPRHSASLSSVFIHLAGSVLALTGIRAFKWKPKPQGPC